LDLNQENLDYDALYKDLSHFMDDFKNQIASKLLPMTSEEAPTTITTSSRDTAPDEDPLRIRQDRPYMRGPYYYDPYQYVLIYILFSMSMYHIHPNVLVSLPRGHHQE
jgi:hypothetical protein